MWPSRFPHASPPRRVGGYPDFLNPLPSEPGGLSDSFPLLLGEAECVGWRLQYSMHVFWSFQCDESPVTGAPDGLWGCPAACDHSWSAGGSWCFLSTSSKWQRGKTKQNRTGKPKPNPKPSWRGKLKKKKMILIFFPNSGITEVASSPHGLHYL